MPHTSWLRDLHGRGSGVEKVVKGRTSATVISANDRTTVMSSATIVACTKPAHNQNSQHSSLERRDAHECPFLAEDLMMESGGARVNFP